MLPASGAPGRGRPVAQQKLDQAWEPFQAVAREAVEPIGTPGGSGKVSLPIDDHGSIAIHEEGTGGPVTASNNTD